MGISRGELRLWIAAVGCAVMGLAMCFGGLTHRDSDDAPFLISHGVKMFIGGAVAVGLLWWLRNQGAGDEPDDENGRFE